MHMEWRWRKNSKLKKNYCNKLITSLEVDGKIIKDKKTNIAQAVEQKRGIITLLPPPPK